MTKGRNGAAASTAATEPVTQRHVFMRIAALGWSVDHTARYAVQDGSVRRDETILLWQQHGALSGTGATFDEAFLDLAQKVLESSAHLLDLANVLQETITAAMAASEAA